MDWNEGSAAAPSVVAEIHLTRRAVGGSAYDPARHRKLKLNLPIRRELRTSGVPQVFVGMELS